MGVLYYIDMRKARMISLFGSECCISSIMRVRESIISGHPNPDFPRASSLPNPRARPKSQIFRSQFLFTWLTTGQGNCSRQPQKRHVSAVQARKQCQDICRLQIAMHHVRTFGEWKKTRMKMKVTVQVTVRVANVA